MQKTKMKKRCRDGVTCVVLCTLPSIYLVCVVFGTAIPIYTSTFLENVFLTFYVLTNIRLQMIKVLFVQYSDRVVFMESGSDVKSK